MRKHFNELFTVDGGKVSAKITVNVNGVTMGAGLTFNTGLQFNGVDISQYEGKYFDVEIENGVNKIKGVYDNFNADPKASHYLVNSNILDMIQKVYLQIGECTAISAKNLYEYDQFIQESDRLIDTWNHQQMN